MNTPDPRQSIFYSIEQAIKEYRKYAQHQISIIVPDITLDQTLVLILIYHDKDFSQKEIAEFLFKDYASLTRIIEILVKNSFLNRSENSADRRKKSLKLTAKGKKTIDRLTPVIFQNRINALDGITTIEMAKLKSTLNKITTNCKTK